MYKPTQRSNKVLYPTNLLINTSIIYSLMSSPLFLNIDNFISQSIKNNH